MARAILLLLLTNVIGGLSYPAQKAALEGLPPATVALLRSLVALACMAAWLAPRGEMRWPWDRKETGRLALVGILGLAAPLLLGVAGVERSTAANASILILLEPVSILLFSRLLLGERVGGTRGAGVALGLAGALCVVAEGAGEAPVLGGGHLAGNLMLAASGFLWGLYTPLLAPLAKRHGAVPLTMAATLFALAVFGPAAALEADRWRAGPDLLPALAWTAGLGVLVSFVGTAAWNAALRDVPSSVVAPFVLLQPAVGSVAGVLWLGEDLSAQAVAGGVLAAGGVVLVIAGERGRERAA